MFEIKIDCIFAGTFASLNEIDFRLSLDYQFFISIFIKDAKNDGLAVHVKRYRLKNTDKHSRLKIKTKHQHCGDSEAKLLHRSLITVCSF